MKLSTMLVLLTIAVLLAGCGGGGGGTPPVAYSVSKLDAAYEGALMNSAGQILTLEQSRTNERFVVLNPDETVTDRSSIPAGVRPLYFSDGGYLLTMNGMDFYVYSPEGSSQQLETPGSDPGSLSYAAIAVNSSGIAVGEKLVPQSAVPAKWDATGHVTLLDLPNGYDRGVANDINDSGVIAGYVCTSSDITHLHDQAVTWDADGNVTLIDPGKSADSRGLLINNVGEVAGTLGSKRVVWSTDGHVSRTLQTVADYDPSIVLKDINDSGIVVGLVYRDLGETSQAVMWNRSGKAKALAPLAGGSNTEAWYISNSGVIVGGCMVTSEPWSGAVLWRPVQAD